MLGELWDIAAPSLAVVAGRNPAALPAACTVPLPAVCKRFCRACSSSQRLLPAASVSLSVRIKPRALVPPALSPAAGCPSASCRRLRSCSCPWQVFRHQRCCQPRQGAWPAANLGFIFGAFESLAICQVCYLLGSLSILFFFFFFPSEFQAGKTSRQKELGGGPRA